ncbi:MAG: MBL fold metallo-hydrolase, partial [Ferruginibacter sp.]
SHLEIKIFLYLTATSWKLNPYQKNKYLIPKNHSAYIDFLCILLMLYTTSLNSGSNGNCYYIGNNHEAVLVDAGLSCRETEKRMHRLGLQMKTVKAIFVSHEHGDHIRGVEVLAKKYDLPVFISDITYKHSGLRLPANQLRILLPGVPVHVGSLQVKSFLKLHDAADPHSFMISHAGINIGVFTDIGKCCGELSSHFAQCHAAYLEANYDIEMLENGRYPVYLKHRIRGGKGHLSNAESLEIFIKHRPSFMSHLFLSHLSKDNNCPQKVQSLFETHAGDTRIVIASRYEETELYAICPNTAAPVIVRRLGVQIGLWS